MSAKYLIAILCGKNDFEKTQNCIKLMKDPGLFENEYINLGVFLFNQNLFNDCIYSCNKALFINPKNTSALINIGLCYYKLGKLEESISIYKKALSIDPSSEYAQMYLKIEENINKR